MPSKTRQFALAWSLKTIVLVVCIVLLVRCHTTWGGAEWGHRSFQLVSAGVLSFSSGIMVWAIPKRQVFIISIALSMGGFLLAADTVWECALIHFAEKLIGTGVMLTQITILRKMGTHLRTGKWSSGDKRPLPQLTFLQKVLYVVYVASAAVDVAKPGRFVTFPVLEMLALVGIFVGGCAHFLTFKRSTDRSFGQMMTWARVLVPLRTSGSSALSDDNIASSPQHRIIVHRAAVRVSQLTRVRRTQKNMSRNMLVNFVIFSMCFGISVFISPLWSGNVMASRFCQVAPPLPLFLFCVHAAPLGS
jgi:hypothetical protein